MESRERPVVMITGASSGIGEALAREYARRGAHLVLLARRADRLERLERELSIGDRKVLALSCDVTRDGDLENAVGEAVKEFGRLDVVIANAGFGVNGLAEDLSLEDYRRQFETNVYGVLRTFQAALPELKKSRGRFAIVGSVSGHVATPTTSAYAMSKFAVRAFADSARAELTRYGVSVTLISPGFIRSDIRRTDNRGQFHEAAQDPAPTWLIMPASTAARKMARAIARRQRERVITLHGWLGVMMQKFCPCLMAWILGRVTVKTRQERMNER